MQAGPPLGTVGVAGELTGFPARFLTALAYTALEVRSAGDLRGVDLLLLPDLGPALSDVRGDPRAVTRLTLTRRALEAGLPAFGVGRGAQALGRALGAAQHSAPQHAGRTGLQRTPAGLLDPVAAALPGCAQPSPEVSALPQGGELLATCGGLPLLWRAGSAYAWAGHLETGDFTPGLAAALRLHVHGSPARRPGTPLERVGGPDVVRAVVNDFYTRVDRDALLGPVFRSRLPRWEPHLEKLYAFWETVLGGEPRYRGHALRAHAGLELTSQHFERWLSLFEETLRAHLDDEEAAEAFLTPARRMASRLGR
ncbi:hemoglobin [Deinobacterium chartae]|uniref:Hemoglobin n=1 Tax=Deinobacterium chartae TaxID=521158 RepID=A0A841I1V2_9DEIO|nr:hemoglobin [Deinobacterium chartae]